jgi:hypothetical protein
MSTTTTDIPEWMRPYSQELLAKADALTSTPYQSYGGERVAQFTPLQKTAFGRAEGQQVAGQIGTATGLAGLAGASSFTAPGTAGQFMSPYMQNVVEMQQRDAQRQADIAGTQRGAQAVRAGAFGGSRQAIMDAEAGRNLSQQMGDIQTTGLQSAFDRAQQQFNAEQANRLQAGQVLGQLGQQQFGQEMDITGQQAQFGGQQRQATQDILNTQYQDFLNKQRAPYDQLSFMSGIFRGTPMGQTTTTTDPKASSTSQLVGLGTAAAGLYGSYLDNQTAKTPVRAAGGPVYSYAAGGIASLNQPEMAAMAGGMSDQQLQQVTQSPNRPELEKLTFAAQQQKNDDLRMQTEAMRAKGNVSNITSTLAQMPDAQLQQYAKLNKNDPYVMALVVAEAKRRKEGGMPSQDAPTVVDQQIAGMAMPEEQGIAQLPVGNMEFAGGGIIAFQNRGAVPEPEEATSPFGDAARGAFRRISDFSLEGEANRQFANMTPAEKATQLRSERARIKQRLFEPLTRTERAEREEKLRAFDQEIAAIESEIASPVVAGLDAAIMTDEARKRAPGQAAAQAAETPTGVGPGITSLIDRPAGESRGIPKLFDEMYNVEKTAEEEALAIERGALATDKTDREQGVKDAEKFGSDREARLKKREESTAADEKKNFNTALIETGLAIMAGESPNALTNIAKGARQGLKGYEERLEKIRVNKEKLDDDFSRLYELREEKVGAAKDKVREINKEIARVEAGAKRHFGQMSSALIGRKVDFTMKEIESVRADARANASTNNPERQAFNDILKKNKGDAVAALTEFNQRFGKKELDPGVKAGLEYLYKKKADVVSSSLPPEMVAKQTAAIDAEIAKLTGGGQSGGKIATMADIRATAAKQGMTEKQVMDAAIAQGYTIQ